MTEQEWLAGNRPRPLLEFLGERLTSRKQVLLVSAYQRPEFEKWRDEQEQEPGPLGLRVLAVAEQVVEGTADPGDVDRARHAIRTARAADPFGVDDIMNPIPGMLDVLASTLDIATNAASILSIGDGGANFSHPFPPLDSGNGCRIVREIFNNPFHPVTINQAWLTSTVVTLAQSIYADNDFSALPILADALQDAGCNDEHILIHCRRKPGKHFRGCWCLDLILSKC